MCTANLRSLVCNRARLLTGPCTRVAWTPHTYRHVSCVKITTAHGLERMGPRWWWCIVCRESGGPPMGSVTRVTNVSNRVEAGYYSPLPHIRTCDNKFPQSHRLPDSNHGIACC